MKNSLENNKAVIYARVSSKEQEETGYSLPAQERLIEEYGKRKDLEIDKVFSVAESASGKVQREVFTEMMGYVSKKNIKLILCEKVDRMSRNFKEALVINDWLEADPNRQVHFVKQNLVVHKGSKSDDRFRWDIEIVLAKKYIANLSEEVRKGQAEKIRQGWMPTKPALGYMTVGEKGHKTHKIDPDVAPYIKQMFTLYATGNYSLKALESKMYELGLRSRHKGKVNKSLIHRMLSDPFYYGSFGWKNELYKGKQEPIVSRDLYDQVQIKLNRVCGPYKTKTEVELRGKIFCGNCTKTITWESQKGNSYGGCKQCKAQIGKDKKYIRQEDLEDSLLAKIASIAPKSERVVEILEQALKESHAEEIELHDTQYRGINNQLVRIQERMRTMYDDKLDGRITGEMYDDRIKQFGEEKEMLLHSLQKLEADNTQYYKVGFAIHELALLAKNIYLSEKASVEERRLLLSYAFSNVTILRGEIKVEYTKPFNFLAEWMPQVNKVLELEKTLVNKRQKTPFGAFHPTLLRRQDSNLRPIDYTYPKVS
jgi:DNA invertase Pin-like site-specific DNA recombinase